MAGNNDRIHSYNLVYRNNLGPLNFYSFQAVRSQFIYRPVNITDGTLGVLDHQGHIVPQNILNTVLNQAMQDMYDACPDEDAAALYAANPIRPWLRDAYIYGITIGIPMFSFDEQDPESRLGDLFSIITWNPVNICRAPGDETRGGYPGNAIDVQVANYLAANAAAQGVDPAWMVALNAVIANTNAGTVTAYLNACSATLNFQETAGMGYYTFPWEWAAQQAEFVALSPDLAAAGGRVLIPYKK